MMWRDLADFCCLMDCDDLDKKVDFNGLQVNMTWREFIDLIQQMDNEDLDRKVNQKDFNSFTQVINGE